MPCVIIGGLCQALCQMVASYEILLGGRLIIGVTGGIMTTVVPIYMAEIAPARARGILGALNNLTLILGVVAGLTLGIQHLMGTRELWHWSLGLNVPMGAANAAFLAFSPESPKFLILTKGRLQQGRQALLQLHGTNKVYLDMTYVSPRIFYSRALHIYLVICITCSKVMSVTDKPCARLTPLKKN